MDNLTEQKVESESLAAIYEENWCIVDEERRQYHITIMERNIMITLQLEFPKTYPSDSPPVFLVISTSLSEADKDELTSILKDSYLEKRGEPIVFDWIGKIKDWMQNKSSILPEEDNITEKNETSEAPTSPEDIVTEEEICAELQGNLDTYEDSRLVDALPAEPSCFDIVHGYPITFKKSTFQGHAATIFDIKDVKEFMRELMENKKIAHATHNIQAYRIFNERKNTYDQDFEDDGEKQAGRRLLHLMEMMKVRNVIVVVSRWYGGIHLGPDRFRFINDAAREVLEKGNFLEEKIK